MADHSCREAGLKQPINGTEVGQTQFLKEFVPLLGVFGIALGVCQLLVSNEFHHVIETAESDPKSLVVSQSSCSLFSVYKWDSPIEWPSHHGRIGRRCWRACSPGCSLSTLAHRGKRGGRCRTVLPSRSVTKSKGPVISYKISFVIVKCIPGRPHNCITCGHTGIPWRRSLPRSHPSPYPSVAGTELLLPLLLPLQILQMLPKIKKRGNDILWPNTWRM